MSGIVLAFVGVGGGGAVVVAVGGALSESPMMVSAFAG